MTEAVGDVDRSVCWPAARAPTAASPSTRSASAQPVTVLSQPLFNPTGGYASYVVPAAFLLILQQTLLMAVVTLGSGSAWRLPRSAPRCATRSPSLFGRALAHVAFSAPGFALYLIMLPRFYGFSAMASPLTLALIAAPYVLAISFLGQWLGAIVCAPRGRRAVADRRQPADVLSRRRRLAARR